MAHLHNILDHICNTNEHFRVDEAPECFDERVKPFNALGGWRGELLATLSVHVETDALNFFLKIALGEGGERCETECRGADESTTEEEAKESMAKGSEEPNQGA